MRKSILVPLLALYMAVAAGAGVIRLPEVKTAPVPVNPLAPVVLSAETLYVIDSDCQLIVLGSPDGRVKVVEEAGPLRIRGKFVDGTGGYETRTYKGKWVYTVDAVPGRAGAVELIVVPVGVKAAGEVIRRTLTLGDDPMPPEPQPPPKPDPAPTEPAKLIVLVIEETAEAAPTRGALFTNPDLAKRMADKGHRWRVVDKDVIGPDGKPPADLTRFLAASGGKKLPQLFLVDEKGKTRVQQDLPAKASGLIELLEKYGG